MEGIVFDRHGRFREWLWPRIDACDVVSLNAYPMGSAAWFGYGAFEESLRFLHDARVRNASLASLELRLRRALGALERAGKPLILSETGFPSAVGYRMEGERLVVPESDNARLPTLDFLYLVRPELVQGDHSLPNGPSPGAPMRSPPGGGSAGGVSVADVPTFLRVRTNPIAMSKRLGAFHSRPMNTM